MIELFAIFSKGGLVLWSLDKSKNFFKEAIDGLLDYAILQVNSFDI